MARWVAAASVAGSCYVAGMSVSQEHERRRAHEQEDFEAAPSTPREAIRWLRSRGAHPWLVRHHELVLEAAEQIVEDLASNFGLRFDTDHVLLGAALHDVGKLEHPIEMRERGSAHEPSGERLLRREGFPEHIARACVTHASWSEPRATLEDRLIALADKLWKGKRDSELETALLEELAGRAAKPVWEVFDHLDNLCERVAADGPERLRRSNV